jgi:membrane dipeptidase
MPFLIDAHADLAYSMLTFGRDYLHSAYEIRLSEVGTPHPRNNGDALLGWPEYQRGQVGLVVASLFIMPAKYSDGGFETQVYSSPAEAYRLTLIQRDLYQKICQDHPDKFRLIENRQDLTAVVQAWRSAPAEFPERTHPIGLVLMMEGAEGVSGQRELEEWRRFGVRIIAPVWAGTRYCGGTKVPGRFTKEGFQLLESMAELGYTLDIAHMSEESVFSHANARALLREDPNGRHLTDRALRRLFERDGVIGVMPYNRALLPGWKDTDPRESVTLSMLIDHIDHICQIAGDASHVGIGSDFDGGFGWPAAPLEVDTIADLQKIGPLLAERGYREEDIAAIFHGNWLRKLEQGLPE